MANPTPIVWPKPDIPAKRKTVKHDEITSAVAKSPFRKMNLILTDDEYQACTRVEWQAIFAETNTKAIQYVPEVEDCDDRAALARGLVPAIANVNGIAWVLDPSSKHSYNVVLVLKDDGDIEVVAVEPQLDEFEQGGSGHYKGSDGWLIF